MISFRKSPSLSVALCGALALAPLLFSGVESPSAIADMTAASSRFLESLTSSQASKAQMAFDDGERTNWAYVPKDRRGVPLKDLNPRQRELVKEVLESLLSEGGRRKVDNIIALEGVLFALEGAAHRDVELYYLSVFGEPAVDSTWGWRFEGHHLSLNVSIVEGRWLAAVPNFWGANPAEVRKGSEAMKGLRSLKDEEELARQLLGALSVEQREIAVFAEKAFRDIMTKAKPGIDRLERAGLAFKDMTASQQSQLQSLIDVYLNNMRPEIARAQREQIESNGLDSIRFGWAGSPNRGEGHYYRIQGPSFLIEYDNVQGGSNHIHAVWREFDGDFGRDLLAEHYRDGHAH